MKYCAVFGCNSKSTVGGKSFFAFPRDKILRKTWAFKTRRKNFTPTQNSSICSLHFKVTDFTQHMTKRRLSLGAIPSLFDWNETVRSRKLPTRHQLTMETESPTTSEHLSHPVMYSSTSSQTEECSYSGRFSVDSLIRNPDKDLVKFYTGFNTIQSFHKVLKYILPDGDRGHIKYYNVRSKDNFCSMRDIFDSDGDQAVDGSTVLGDQMPSIKKAYNHKLSVVDEFLLVMMRLRLGLFYEDIGMRFGISAATVHRILYSWINYMYSRLGSIKCFPHRDVIISVMKEEFKKDYPTTMIISDCTEIKVEMPFSLLRQSQTFSNYKSTNTLKALIGVDSLGGVMFVSQLYGGSISDKEICKRSGLYDLLTHKIECGELLKGDAIMADKGFSITKEVEECGLRLNIPPFLPPTGRFSTDDIINTKTIAKHRIHVERAIRKIRRFHIFDRKIQIGMLEVINQIWLVSCMLTNFQDPVIC